MGISSMFSLSKPFLQHHCEEFCPYKACDLRIILFSPRVSVFDAVAVRNYIRVVGVRILRRAFHGCLINDRGHVDDDRNVGMGAAERGWALVPCRG